jgi:serine O-acetyltransferase
MGALALLRADQARLRALSSLPATDASAVAVWLRCFSPRVMPVALYRYSHALHASGLRAIAKLPAWINFALFGIEIPPRLAIGPGLVLAHTQGTVLGAWRIGADALIFQQVTLGAKALDMQYLEALRPVIGDGVTIGAGARVLGGVKVGDRATIGANAVVTEDVPADSVATGVPARVGTAATHG